MNLSRAALVPTLALIIVTHAEGCAPWRRGVAPTGLTQPSAASRTLRVGWVYDRGSHVAANRAGRNCCFPFWFHDDWRGGNRRIHFLEQPVTAYECGYVGQERTDFPTVHKIIDLAARYHLTMNMFYHPIYIDQFPHCRAAIDEAQRYMKEREIRALHLGSDGLSRWWTARSETQVTRVALAGHSLSFLVETRYSAGAIIKVPLSQKTVQSVSVNGAPARSVTEQRFGQRWLLIVVPSGHSRVECAWSDAPAASPGS